MPNTQPEQAQPSIVLFDGVCNFCSASVRFVIDRDPHAQFKFASMQSAVGQRLLAQHEVSTAVDSMVLIADEGVFLKSNAALAIARRLKFPWRVFYLLKIVPGRIRDWCYDEFAKRRYRWFGRSDACQIPSANYADRFLDETS